MLSRRDFFYSTLALYAAWPRQLFAGAVQQNPRFPTSPFTLGVASGDPSPTGIVLWTRLAPDPLHGGGMPPQPVEVEWRIATDDKVTRIVNTGKSVAAREWGHSVHVEVEGLEPAHAVLVPIPRGQRAEPGGAHQNISCGRHGCGPASVCLRVVPALRAGSVHRFRPYGA